MNYKSNCQYDSSAEEDKWMNTHYSWTDEMVDGAINREEGYAERKTEVKLHLFIYILDQNVYTV